MYPLFHVISKGGRLGGSALKCVCGISLMRFLDLGKQQCVSCSFLGPAGYKPVYATYDRYCVTAELFETSFMRREYRKGTIRRSNVSYALHWLSTWSVRAPCTHRWQRGYSLTSLCRVFMHLSAYGAPHSSSMSCAPQPAAYMYASSSPAAARKRTAHQGPSSFQTFAAPGVAPAWQRCQQERRERAILACVSMVAI